MYALPVVGVVVVGLGALWFVLQSDTRHVEVIYVGNTAVWVTRADTPELRAQGLSGRPSLPEGEGMFFVFQTPGTHSFWMKDMLFPIDIVWIDAAGVVVGIEKAVAPETYPETFTPPVPVRYVLEVPAGLTERALIEIGEQLSF